jgi:flagellar assembly protein FliH
MSSSAEPFEFGDLAPLATVAGASEATIESIVDDARSRGHAEGFAAGREQALTALAPAADALAAAVAGAEAEQAAFLDRAERAAVELALALSSKIVGSLVDARPQIVLDVVAGALRRTTVRDELVLEVNPEDFELVRDAAEGIAGRIGGIRRMDVVAERRISRGGCVVRTGEGEIDAQVSEQLARAAELIAEQLGVPAADA